MSESSWVGDDDGAAPRAGPWFRRMLAGIGRATRGRAQFILFIASLGFGVAGAAIRPSNWRRTVRAEFRRVLRQAVGGGFSPILITAALIGLAMVSQALYWLGQAGQEGLIGTVLVTVLLQQLAPVLVGLILLGRSGSVAISEIGRLQIGGQIRTFEAQGLDPFQLLLLPRACALAVAAFTLGVLFVLAALLTGFVAGSLLEAVQMTIWTFFDRVLLAMRAGDFIVFPAKMIVIGLLVALVAGLTGFTARTNDDIADLLPRGFVRGLFAILVASVALSLVA